MISPSYPAHFLAPYQGARPPAPAWFLDAINHAPQRTFFTSSGANIEQLRQARANALKPRAESASFATLAEGLARFRLSPPQECVNDFIGDHIARCGLIEREGRWYWHFDPRRITTDDSDRNAVVSRVRCPLAFIHGERSVLVPPEVVANTVALLPAGTPIVSIPNAAHHILIDQPLALVSSLRTLLACWPRAERAATAPAVVSSP